MSVIVALLARVGPGFRFLRGRCEEGVDMMEKEVLCLLKRMDELVEDR